MTETHTRGRDRVENAGADCRSEALGGRCRGVRRRRGEHCERRSHTGDGCGREQLASGVPQSGQRLVEHFTDHAATVGGMEQFADEQRVAAGPSPQLHGVDRCSGLSRGELTHGIGVESFETHDTRYPPERVETGHVRLVVRLVATTATGASPSARRALLEHPQGQRFAQCTSSRTTIAGADKRRAPARASTCSHRRSPGRAADHWRLDPQRPIDPAPQFHRLVVEASASPPQHGHAVRPGDDRHLVGEARSCRYPAPPPGARCSGGDRWLHRAHCAASPARGHDRRGHLRSPRRRPYGGRSRAAAEYASSVGPSAAGALPRGIWLGLSMTAERASSAAPINGASMPNAVGTMSTIAPGAARTLLRTPSSIVSRNR